jgi:hypothetical protein
MVRLAMQALKEASTALNEAKEELLVVRGKLKYQKELRTGIRERRRAWEEAENASRAAASELWQLRGEFAVKRHQSRQSEAGVAALERELAHNLELLAIAEQQAAAEAAPEIAVACLVVEGDAGSVPAVGGVLV